MLIIHGTRQKPDNENGNAMCVSYVASWNEKKRRIREYWIHGDEKYVKE